MEIQSLITQHSSHKSITRITITLKVFKDEKRSQNDENSTISDFEHVYIHMKTHNSTNNGIYSEDPGYNSSHVHKNTNNFKERGASRQRW